MLPPQDQHRTQEFRDLRPKIVWRHFENPCFPCLWVPQSDPSGVTVLFQTGLHVGVECLIGPAIEDRSAFPCGLCRLTVWPLVTPSHCAGNQRQSIGLSHSFHQAPNHRPKSCEHDRIEQNQCEKEFRPRNCRQQVENPTETMADADHRAVETGLNISTQITSQRRPTRDLLRIGIRHQRSSMPTGDLKIPFQSIEEGPVAADRKTVGVSEEQGPAFTAPLYPWRIISCRQYQFLIPPGRAGRLSLSSVSVGFPLRRAENWRRLVRLRHKPRAEAKSGSVSVSVRSEVEGATA